MPFNIQCPHCRQFVAVDEAYAGHPIGCPYCNQGMTVPTFVQPPPLLHPASPYGISPPGLVTSLPTATGVSAGGFQSAAVRRSVPRKKPSNILFLTGMIGIPIVGLLLCLVLYVNRRNGASVSAEVTSGKAIDSNTSISSSAKQPQLPFSLTDFRSSVGPPHQETATYLLYNGAMKISTSGNDITVAFNAGTMEGLFYAAGLFKERIFRYPEGDEIMDQIDNIGHEGRTKRFRYRIENAVIPTGWRQVRFMPLG